MCFAFQNMPDITHDRSQKVSETEADHFEFQPSPVDLVFDRIGWRPVHTRVLILCSLGYFACGAEFTLLSLVGAETRNYFQVSLKDYGYLASIANAVSLVAGISFGFIADKFGRRWSFVLAQILVCIGGFGAAFSPSWETFLASRCVCAFGLGGLQVLDFVFLAELLPPKDKPAKSQIVFLGGCLGFVYLAGLDWITKAAGIFSWRLTTLLAVLPMVPALFMRIWMKLESPRWLLRQGRLEEAKATILGIAGLDGCDLQGLDGGEAVCVPSRPTRTTSSLFIKNSLCIAACWGIQGVVYSGGMPFYKDLLKPGNFFPPESVMLIVAVAEIPGVFFSAFLSRKFGRLATCNFFFIGTAIAALASSFSTNHSSVFVSFLAIFFFFHIPIWGLLFTVTPELFPGSIRARAVGVCSMVKSAASVAGPLIGLELVGNPREFMWLWSGLLLAGYLAGFFLTKSR